MDKLYVCCDHSRQSATVLRLQPCICRDKKMGRLKLALKRPRVRASKKTLPPRAGTPTCPKFWPKTEDDVFGIGASGTSARTPLSKCQITKEGSSVKSKFRDTPSKSPFAKRLRTLSKSTPTTKRFSPAKHTPSKTHSKGSLSRLHLLNYTWRLPIWIFKPIKNSRQLIENNVS